MKLRSCLFLLVCLALPARADTTLVFNEIMYHPQTNEPALEWVELRNQLAVDLDISGWSIAGGIQYTFPAGSIVPGGGFAVVAISPGALEALTGLTNLHGPFNGRLGNNGEHLELRNNSGRVMDQVDYGVDGDWPVAPDGSGVSLAKLDRDAASGPAASWTSSEQVGGTPGADNFPFYNSLPLLIKRIAIDSEWQTDDSGTDLGAAWREPGFDDGAWTSRAVLTNRAVPGLFNTGVGANGVALAAGALDPHYLITAAAQGPVNTNATVMSNHANWLANDTVSSWIGVVSSGTANVNVGGYNYQTAFSLAGFIPSTVQLNFTCAVDNDLTNVALNGVATGLSFSGFGAWGGPFTLSSGFVTGTNTLEFRTFNIPTTASPHGFRALVSGSGLTVNPNLPLASGRTTYYFRKTFVFNGDPVFTRLKLNTVLADGGVFYLNGQEVYRQNMPQGPIDASTPALADVTVPVYSGLVPISADSLVIGTNVLAVEVHQAAGGSEGAMFGVELFSTPLPEPPVTLAFNEFSASTNAEFWLELVNYGTNSIPLDGYVIFCDGTNSHNSEYVFPMDNLSLASGAFLALTNSTLGFHPVSGDKLYLYSPSRTNVLDSVAVKKAPRARYPDAAGEWLRPNLPTPGAPNNFAFHNEIVINEIMYHHSLLPPTNNLPPKESPEAWIELFNRSATPVDLTAWELTGGISYRFSPGKVLAPGAYLVVAKDAAYLRALYPGLDIVGDFDGRLSGKSDLIRLRDANENPADEVRYFDGGRWPEYANGAGSSLELRDPNADNSKAEAWAASDETRKTSWQSYSYRMVASVPAGSGQPTQWNDFIFGLLSGGECLIDDISVVESPTNAPVPFIANGDFENGLTGWRVLGNHGHSRVEVDPDNPGNHVLHLVATGPQEHMHNHIETTYINSRSVVTNREYQISFRARWLAGNNLLNTRLYFNRVARTTALPMPALNGTPGAPNSRYEANIGPTFSQLQHHPVVPQPDEAVTVSVVAQDPQGVGACELWWSVNGGAWSNAPMARQTGDRFTGTIPSCPAGALVQFYVRAVDGSGAVATFPAAGPDSGALYAVADGQANFSLGHNLRILLTPANRALLHAFTNVMSNDNLPCTVIYDEKRAYYDMTVRLKGSERGRYNDTRVSFHLNFQPDDLFRGVHPVMLADRSGAGDSTANKQQEIVIRHILLHAGNIPGTYPDLCRVIAPISLHTGPAILSPRHEDEFMGTAYPNGGDGTLWEMELIYYPTTTNQFGYKNPNPDGVIGTDLTDLGNDKEIYRYNFIIKNHRDLDDYSRFMAFAKALSLSSNQLDQATRQLMDVDEWMRVWAHVTLCGVNDSYTFGNNHNLLMYLRPSDQKMVAFPVDMDFSFYRVYNAALVGDQNISKLINLPSNLRVFYAHILDIINTTFNSAYISYWADHYDNFCPGQNFSGVPSYVQQRGDYAKSIINGAGGNAAFVVNSTNITTTNNLVTLSGTAPVQVRTIKVNGVEYPVTWASVSGWTLMLPVSAPTNLLEVQGYDLAGNLLTNFTREVTVNYTGPIPSPEGSVVINEIMYNSSMPDAAYVELFNISNFSFDLSGWRFNGLDFIFPPGSIMTNRQLLVLANDLPAYAAAYPSAPAPFAAFQGNLQNDGETLTLFRPGSVPEEEIVVNRVRYESLPPWSTNANGAGSSLQLVDPAQDNARVSNWGDGTGWRFYSYTSSPGGSLPTNKLSFFLASAGDLYLDNISLVGTNAAGELTNFLANGDFEAGALAPWMAIGNHSNSTVSTAFHGGGNCSLHLVSSAGGNARTACVYYELVGLPLANRYTLSFWYLPTTNVSGFNFYMTSPFRSMSTISVQPTFLTPGQPNSVAVPLPPYPPLWLNEVQPENLAGITDSAGEHDPWLELYNAGADPLSLDGFYLSDNYSNLTQWAFPAEAVIQPGEFKIVFADATPGQSTPDELHTSFRLNGGTGSIALARLVSGQAQVVDYLNYTGIPAGRSYGSSPDGQPFYRQQFYHVTPGATNNGAPPPITVYLNEWMASNTRTLLNTANGNRYDDWFEIYNPGPAVADLSGYFLTDTLTNQFAFQVPRGYIIPPGGYLLVWADGSPGLNHTNDPDLHVNFRLNLDGEAIGLFAADGTPIDTVTFGLQSSDASEGRYPDGAGPAGPLRTPTPRAPNAASANVPPVLASIADQTIYPGEVLSVTLTATDSDLPPQALTFSLDLSPADASIDPANGLFRWASPVTQVPGTNTVIVRVTDDGTPAQSAAQTFSIRVVPLPVIQGVRVSPERRLTFSFPTLPGKTYRVEFKDDLAAPAWLPLGPDRPATGEPLAIDDDLGPSPQRFYRISLVQ